MDPAGYINGGNLYQFVVGNPVALVDPLGLEESAPSKFDGTGKYAPVKIGDKTIGVGAILTQNGGEEYIRIIARPPKEDPNGYHCDKCEVIQFVHRIVTDPGPGKIVFKNKNGDTYDNTTDPDNPKYRTDNNKAGSPLASKEYTGARRNADKRIFDFADAPKFGVDGKAEKVIFDTYLVCDGKVTFHVHWERHKTAMGVKSYENVSGEAASGLPPWAVKTLTDDGFENPTGG